MPTEQIHDWQDPDHEKKIEILRMERDVYWDTMAERPLTADEQQNLERINNEIEFEERIQQDQRDREHRARDGY